MHFWRRGNDAIKHGVTLVNIKKMKVLSDIVRMKFNISNDSMEDIDKLEARLEQSFNRLESAYV